MHQVPIICQCEVCRSTSALRALELEGRGPDEAIVVQTIEESMAVHVVDALRIDAADSILADGVFDYCTVWLANCGHREGAWRYLAWNRCCRGADAQREKRKREHSEWY
jgi:hypothetical protein